MKIEEIKPRLRAARASTQELADFMGVEHHIADNIVNARRKHLRQAEVEIIRRFFELRERPLYPEPGPANADARRPHEVGDHSPGRAEIPLFAGTDTPDGWMLSLSAHQQVGRVMAHPSQARAGRAFAVEVVDDKMSPRFEPGEIAYVTAGILPRKGQDCLVEYKNLTAQLLQFVERNDRRVVLRQLNPVEQVILKPGDGFVIHAVVGRG